MSQLVLVTEWRAAQYRKPGKCRRARAFATGLTAEGMRLSDLADRSARRIDALDQSFMVP